MRTTITYTDGKIEEYYDLMPSVSADPFEVQLIDFESNCEGNELPCEEIARIVFEPNVERPNPVRPTAGRL